MQKSLMRDLSMQGHSWKPASFQLASNAIVVCATLKTSTMRTDMRPISSRVYIYEIDLRHASVLLRVFFLNIHNLFITITNIARETAISQRNR